MKFFSLVATCCLLTGSLEAQTGPVGDAPTNPALAASAWPNYHGGPARQASSDLPGPTITGNAQLRFFSDDPGFNLGTSPWHNVSDRTYTDSSSARTIWGSSLTHVYKFVADGDRFAYVDSWRVHDIPAFIAWNFAMLPGGRVLVPAPNGMQSRQERGRPSFRRCTSTRNGRTFLGDSAALFVFSDGAESGSKITCEKRFEIRRDHLRQACGLSARPSQDQIVFGGTAVGTDVLYNGDIAIRVRVNETIGDAQTRATYLAVLDASLDDTAASTYRACERLPGETTNGVALLPEPEDGTRLYLPTESGITEAIYSPAESRLEVTGAKEFTYRAGRTGTTPTILFGSDGTEWLLTIDAKCAVSDVFTGTIGCEGGQDPESLAPSRLVAFQLPFEGLTSDQIVTRAADLPVFVNTVENSPSVAGEDIALANYAGYFPRTTFVLSDDEGRETETASDDLQRGVVKLSYRPSDSEPGSFAVDWEREDLQFNGVLTISAGSRAVYGSGARPDGERLISSYYGLDLDTGSTLFKTNLGPAESSSRFRRDEIFDQGNANILLDDGSIIFAGGRVLVRIRD
ncbi:MAG: hypothetical protein AAF690_29755 [Acidobacteriota bacterium]